MTLHMQLETKLKFKREGLKSIPLMTFQLPALLITSIPHPSRQLKATFRAGTILRNQICDQHHVCLRTVQRKAAPAITGDYQ